MQEKGIGSKENMAEVVIIGAGLAGLRCAMELQKHSVDYVILEREKKIGGRVQTDESEGYRYDRGFQIYLDSYEEGKAIGLNKALDLQVFEPGAWLMKDGRKIDFANPFAKPSSVLNFLAGDWASLADKLRLAKIFLTNLGATKDLPAAGRGETALEFLQRSGFDQKAIETFFRPFFAGVFLEDKLETSSAFLKHLLLNFSFGQATLPKAGMGAIPLVLAKGLRQGKILLGADVRFEGGQAYLNGEQLENAHVIDTTNRKVPSQDWNGSLTLYFACSGEKLHARLVVDADASKLIRTAVSLSSVNANYAPEGQNLISCTLKITTQEIDNVVIDSVQRELAAIYKRQAKEIRFMRHYYVREALPSFLPRNQEGRGVKREGNCIIAGDSATYPSINGALLSGRQAAELVLNALKN